MTISLAPLRTARLMREADHRMVLRGVGADDRSMTVHSISSMVLVIAPLPNEVARPATVAACQRRAQWSTLLVPITARKFLEEVVLFVGALGRGENGQGVRPVCRPDGGESAGYDIQGRIPSVSTNPR